VRLEQLEDRALEHERVVDRDLADALDPVPARLSATGDRVVHEVIRHEEAGLHLK
jgi:hypothetical protein